MVSCNLVHAGSRRKHADTAQAAIHLSEPGTVVLGINHSVPENFNIGLGSTEPSRLPWGIQNSSANWRSASRTSRYTVSNICSWPRCQLFRHCHNVAANEMAAITTAAKAMMSLVLTMLSMKEHLTESESRPRCGDLQPNGGSDLPLIVATQIGTEKAICTVKHPGRPRTHLATSRRRRPRSGVRRWSAR